MSIEITERILHEVLTAMQQINFVQELVKMNDNDKEYYDKVISKNTTKLEIIEKEIIGLKEENIFENPRDILFRELEFIRIINFNVHINEKNGIIKLSEKITKEIQMISKKIIEPI